jgi:hypothetical protein
MEVSSLSFFEIQVPSSPSAMRIETNVPKKKNLEIN